MNRHPLKNQNVLIVGGTSGIGLATAVQAKELGANVVIAGSNAERARQAAEQNGLPRWLALDVLSPDTLAPALTDIIRVDHLVLLAGSFVAGKVMEADVTYLRRAFEERTWAAVHILRTLGDRLSSDASITLISGQLADRPSPGTAILASASA